MLSYKLNSNIDGLMRDFGYHGLGTAISGSVSSGSDGVMGNNGVRGSESVASEAALEDASIGV
jgi:hypothetical protein